MVSLKVKKQRVLLIRASYLETHMAHILSPPLGVLTLAAMIRRERPHQVDFRILDAGIERVNNRGAGRIIEEYDPDVVGISALSLEAANIHTIAAVAKSIKPSIKVVVGGPHATIFYDQALKDPNVDYAVVGEGETTFIELLDAIREGAAPVNMPGVALRLDGEVSFGGPRDFQEDLDSLPIPAWDLLDLRPYSHQITMNGLLARRPYAALFTSRACPYKCIYCHGIFGKKFRAQSAERVLEEIGMLEARYGAREIHIYDDVFNFDRGRAMAIMEGVASRGIEMKFAFPNGIRADIMTRDMVKSFARAGVYSITYAIETASPRLQRLIRKNLNLDLAREVIEWTFDEGIIPCGFFMFGFPTETLEEMEQTRKFACGSKMLSAVFFTVVPFPRSELYDMVREYYPDYKMPYDFSPHMQYWSEKPYYGEVTGIDMMKMRYRALKSFYLDPWRIWHMVDRFPKNLSYLRVVYSSLKYWFANYGRKVEDLKIPPSTCS